MPTVHWPVSPIVTLRNPHPQPSVVDWFPPFSHHAAMGDSVVVRIRMVCKNSSDSTWFRYWVQSVDAQNNPIAGTTVSEERVVTDELTDEVRVTLSSQVQRFRVTAQNFSH